MSEETDVNILAESFARGVTTKLEPALRDNSEQVKALAGVLESFKKQIDQTTKGLLLH